jgi:hypothetical protein
LLATYFNGIATAATVVTETVTTAVRHNLGKVRTSIKSAVTSYILARDGFPRRLGRLAATLLTHVLRSMIEVKDQLAVAGVHGAYAGPPWSRLLGTQRTSITWCCWYCSDPALLAYHVGARGSTPTSHTYIGRIKPFSRLIGAI